MELHQLRYLAALARTGNFSRAAEQCHVSQPSLSQQIQKLEDELGERLFDRTKRAARLTPHGQSLLAHALRILDEVEAVRREAGDAKGLLRGSIILGILPTIAPYLLPKVLLAFAQKFPGVDIVVQEDTTAQLLKLAQACEIEFCIASEPIADGRFDLRTLFTEELLAALPPGHRLGKKRTLRLSDLENERFIVMKEGHCLGDQVLNFCERRDLRPSISFRSAQLETVQALVSTGMGVSFIPAMAANPDRPGAPIFRPLENPKPVRKIVAAWPRQRPLSRAAEELLKLVTEPKPPKTQK